MSDMIIGIESGALRQLLNDRLDAVRGNQNWAEEVTRVMAKYTSLRHAICELLGYDVDNTLMSDDHLIRDLREHATTRDTESPMPEPADWRALMERGVDVQWMTLAGWQHGTVEAAPGPQDVVSLAYTKILVELPSRKQEWVLLRKLRPFAAPLDLAVPAEEQAADTAPVTDAIPTQPSDDPWQDVTPASLELLHPDDGPPTASMPAIGDLRRFFPGDPCPDDLGHVKEPTTGYVWDRRIGDPDTWCCNDVEDDHGLVTATWSTVLTANREQGLIEYKCDGACPAIVEQQS